MSLSDFEIEKSDPSFICALVTDGSQIQGAGSLVMDNRATSNQGAAILRHSNAAKRGRVSGRLRVLMHIHSATGSLTESFSNFLMGFYLMRQAGDIIGGADVPFYGVGLGIISGNVNWVFRKFSRGLEFGTGAASGWINLHAVAAPTVAIGNTYAMEVRWIADETELAACEVTFSVGPDFDNLAEIFMHSDTDSPLYESIGEGIVMHDVQGSQARVIYFDDLSFHEYQPE